MTDPTTVILWFALITVELISIRLHKLHDIQKRMLEIAEGNKNGAQTAKR